MGTIFLILGIMGSITGYLVYNMSNYGNIIEEKKEAQKVMESEIDKSLKLLFKETYPHITDEEIKVLIKKEKKDNYIRKSLNFSIKPHKE